MVFLKPWWVGRRWVRNGWIGRRRGEDEDACHRSGRAPRNGWIGRRRGEEEDACHRPSPDKEKYFFIFMMWLHGKIKTNSANLYLCVNVCRYVCIYLINVNVNKYNFHIPLRKWTLMNAATMTKKHWPKKKKEKELVLAGASATVASTSASSASQPPLPSQVH